MGSPAIFYPRQNSKPPLRSSRSEKREPQPAPFCHFWYIIILMPYLPEFLIVAAAHLLAVMAPGPDFIMITRNSLAYSRQTGFYSSIGLGLGILVHVTYSLVGIGFVISQSIVLYSTIKYLGAAYLIYIGYKSLCSKPHVEMEVTHEKKEDISKFAAIRIGFLTNVLNPKATLFFLALFTQVIDPSTPLWVKLLYGLEMTVVTSLWFILVSYMFSHSQVKSRISFIQKYVERAMGAVLIALGIKIALSSSR